MKQKLELLNNKIVIGNEKVIWLNEKGFIERLYNKLFGNVRRVIGTGFLIFCSYCAMNIETVENVEITNFSESEYVEIKNGLYEAGVFLIKKYEGLYLRPYLCSAGIPTIGWGHTFDYKIITIMDSIKTKNGYKKIKKSKVVLTEKGKDELRKYRDGMSFDESQKMFQKDYLKNLEQLKSKLGKIKEQKHLLALTSVFYNAGEKGSFEIGTAPAKSYLNNENVDSTASKIKERYRKNKSFTNGIKKRRETESKMFSSEFNDILKMSKSWKKEVQMEIKKVLPLYGLNETNRQFKKPILTRKSEMTQSKIDSLLLNL